MMGVGDSCVEGCWRSLRCSRLSGDNIWAVQEGRRPDHNIMEAIEAVEAVESWPQRVQTLYVC